MTANEQAPRALGLDFGTTNTVVAWAHPHHPAEPVVFHFLTSLLFAFRSALCFWNEGDDDHPQAVSEAGPWAIQAFIEHAGDCRFIQSLKSFAASRLFESTGIYGRAYKFEDLFNVFFARLREHASPQLDRLPRDVLVGRPVAYAGSRPDAGLAMRRYQAALSPFGFERIRQVYEPVAAAFFYAQSLEDSATVLVADFGGGTTDYSVISFDKSGGTLRATALGHAGVGIAGDRFDYRIIDHVVLPQLGKGTTYRSMGKNLELPRSCFSSFAHWHELSVMKTSRAFRELKEVAVFSDAPELVARFIRLVESDQGYPLYKAVSEAKEALSSVEVTRFSFKAAGFEIDSTVTRAQFESWIEPELEGIEEALEEALANASISHRDVDRVFLTGGSSFVPAVRRIFERRFGADRVDAGNEFVSIANGLATIGLREDVDTWVLKENAPQ
ncbi:MAG: Hsp70 family protein [Burkholderiales bacterium]|nr:Hsp70 family protein [Burkholderiales bacterium]